MGTTEHVHPFTTFINHLFIYPLMLNFDSQKLFSRARNIAVIIELRDSDAEGAKPLSVSLSNFILFVEVYCHLTLSSTSSVSMDVRDIQHLCQRFHVQSYITIRIQHFTKKSNCDFHSTSPINITFYFRLCMFLVIYRKNGIPARRLKIQSVIVGCHCWRKEK